ncbi:basement membrane-specific heparan sulfate proteoglycan core protein isoform X2 [Leuresthes tenuis]|uniref:basement membrane-specific heparan sulfate proteoglycan core protein isoform X2 n=1 Tax=Leuresthes tenuis TaxID=355514 RepID=UPI003B507794
MTQHSNTACIRGARWKMWPLKVFAIIYLTAVCAAQDDVYDPPTPTLKLLTGRPDVFESEVLEFSCEVSGSDWTFTWYRNGVKLVKEGPSFKVPSVTQTDRGQYTCKAHLKSRGVSSGPSNTADVEVYTTKPKPTVTGSPSFAPMYPEESVLLTCTVSVSSGWDYVWFHNGKEIQAANSDTYRIAPIVHSSSGEYRCKAKRGEGPFYSEESDAYSLQVSDPPTPTLKLLTGRPDVFESEVLEFSCEVSGSDWTFTWYRNGVKLVKEGPSFKVPSVTQTDRGQYTCKAHLKSRGVSSGPSNTADVEVYTTKPKPTVTVSPSFAPMYPEESVLLTCTVSVSSGWDYVWFHNGKEIQAANSDTYRIAPIVHSSSGEYRCKAKRGEGPFYSEESDAYSLQVSDPPTPTLKLLTGRPDVFESEVLQFSCEVSGSDWTFTWYRNGVKLVKEEPSFKVPSVTQTDQGQYTCKAHLKSRGVSSGPSNTADVEVYTTKPKPTVTGSPSFAPMYPEESVLLTCTVSVSSGWDYVWFHNEKEIQAANSDTYRIAPIVHSSSGEYRCKAKRGEGPFYSEESDAYSLQVSDPPTPILKQLTGWPDMFENEMAAFSCEVNSSEWTFTWYRDQNRLQTDSVLTLDKRGLTLNITSVAQTHQGLYVCKAHLTSRGVTSGYSEPFNIKVHEKIPVPTLKRNPDLNPMYVGETVTFTCNVDVSFDWNYRWYNDEGVLRDTGKTIHVHFSRSHEGNYSCKASRGVTTSTSRSEKIPLYVHEIPVPLLEPATKWLDVFPTETVKLTCRMQGSSGWIYTWYKDAEEVRVDEIVTSEKDGTTLTIRSSSSSHHGMYSCSGKLKGRSVRSNHSSNVSLHVYDSTPGVTIVQHPEASLMHTGDSVSFSCGSNVSTGWDYVWFKNDHQLVTSGNNHSISSALTTDSGLYKCQAKRGEHTVLTSNQSKSVDLKISARPQAIIILQTTWSEAFSTDSLLLKCEVADGNSWNYTWFRDGQTIDLPPAETHKVTPQDDPEQSQYICRGERDGRPSYSEKSDSYKTKNLLLKRRVLLSISGCLFFGIIAIFIGCIGLRIFRKPVADDEKPDESELFLSMTKLKDHSDVPCPLVEYISDAALKAGPKAMDENLEICSETTPLPITSQEDHAVMTNGHDAAENGSALVSFQQ